MVSRPYKCPLCHATFRNESGRNWHILHRHEIPTAFDVLGKDYDAKMTNQQEETDLLRKKVEDFERKLLEAEIEIVQEQAEKLEETAKVIKLNNETQVLAMVIAIQSTVLKQRLNIEIPNPLESQD